MFYENQIMGGLKKIPEISPTFCVYPWMEFILGPTEYIRLCCIAETAVENENGQAYTFWNTPPEKYWNSYGLRQIRKKMLSGEKIKACEHCYYQESVGRTSYRQSFNKQWFQSEKGKDILNRVEKSKTNDFQVEEQPLYLDIRPGNLCNLKCRMCNPGNSSKVYQEQKNFLKDHSSEISSLVDTVYFKRDEKHFHNWHKNEKIWESLYKWAPEIKQLYFTGGEPTLIKENWMLIDHLQKRGHSKNIDLIFNINCTQIPKKLLNTFETFSTVNIIFSIDGYKETQEYIRHPSNWRQIEDNIIKLLKNKKENTTFYFSPVVQIYNVFNLPQLLNWIDALQIDYGTIETHLLMCTTPEILDIAILPNNIKQKALSKIEKYENSYQGKDCFLLECLGSVKNILKSEEKKDIERHLKRFYKYTTLLDQKRNNNFEKTFPELNYFFNKDGRWKN